MLENNKIVFLIFRLCLLGSVQAQNLLGSSADQQVLQASIYVNQGPDYFYFYQVFSQNTHFIVNIFDQNQNNYTLSFDKQKQNNLYFRAAYYKFIILEEINKTDTLNYWIIQTHRTQNNAFDLKSFPVNSRIDNQGNNLDNSFLLTSIIEYNQFDNFLYVIMESENRTNIYGFDLTNQGNTMKMINWFYINKLNPEVIAGGNSRLLIQTTGNQLWIDTRNARSDTAVDPTIYNKTDLKNLTQLPIYPGGSKVVNLLNSYFQYVSESPDFLNMTFFVYNGYGDQYIQGQVNFVSQVPILTFSDGYNFFLAVGDQDIYFTVVQYDKDFKNYSAQINTLSDYSIQSDSHIYTADIFRKGIRIVYNDYKLYVLTTDTFYVYGGEQYFTPLLVADLNQPITSNSNIDYVMIQQIAFYLFG